MLAFTPAIESVKEWVQWTHEVVITGWTAPYLRLVRLPAVGAIGDQDAWLMDALATYANEINAMLQEHWAKDHPPTTTD